MSALCFQMPVQKRQNCTLNPRCTMSSVRIQITVIVKGVYSKMLKKVLSVNIHIDFLAILDTTLN